MEQVKKGADGEADMTVYSSKEVKHKNMYETDPELLWEDSAERMAETQEQLQLEKHKQK